MDELDTLCVQEELNAQLTLFKERFGFSPSHIDSHHHIHTEWAIMKCVVGLAKKHQINAIRLSRNIGDIAGFKKKLYKGVFNKYLRYKGFKTVDFFGDITDINAKCSRPKLGN